MYLGRINIWVLSLSLKNWWFLLITNQRTLKVSVLKMATCQSYIIKLIFKQFYLARVDSGGGRKWTSLPSLDGVFVIPEISVSASGVETIARSVLGQDSSNLEEEDWSGSVVPFSLVGTSWIFM